MENPEGVLNLLDDFAKLKSKEIPNDLEEYLSYVAASGDPVYQWSLIKSLYRQKLINVITEFYEMCPVVDIPHCPNVDPFNYETMKNSLLKRLDSFSSAPFTIQRISELLTAPRKQYNRVDKFMRAIEKNIWVVSTREPGAREQSNSQETSANLVNGVTPRVCVTVKHPKRVKSIEERIKSGHPQLIDDDEEDEEEEEELDEYEQMEEDNTTEILPSSEADDTSLQCTSVKDLIEKYENGTIFSNSEEKTDFEEKPGQLDEAGIASSSSKVSSVAQTATKIITPIISPETPSNSETPSQSAPEFSTTESLSEAEQEQEPESEPASIEDSTSLIVQCDIEKELIEPVVAADSSSDLACNENEKTDIINSEAPALDSTTDIPFESPQIMAESSTTLKPDLQETVEDSLAMIVDNESEASSLEPTSEVSASNKEFQPSLEPSLDSFSECETKEANVVEKNNECL